MKLTLTDVLFVVAFFTIILYGGYHLHIDPDKFSIADFGQSLMFVLFGHGGVKGINVADKYFNAPDGDNK